MSTVSGTRRAPRRQSQDGSDDKVVVSLEASSPVVGSCRGVPTAVAGARTSPIDVKGIEDEVQAVSPSRVPPQRRNMRTRRQPGTVNLPAASSDAGSGDAASQDASHSTKEATVSASGREQCSHYKHDTAHLDKVLLEILSSEHVALCEHCREDTPRKKGSARSKEKGGKQQKKKGGGARGTAAKVQAKAKNSDMWVCLHCGQHFCGGAVANTKPYGHARRHAKQDRHWWAAKYDDPTVAYCLSCEKELSIEMPKLETVVAVKTDDKMVGA